MIFHAKSNTPMKILTSKLFEICLKSWKTLVCRLHSDIRMQWLNPCLPEPFFNTSTEGGWLPPLPRFSLFHRYRV